MYKENAGFCCLFKKIVVLSQRTTYGLLDFEDLADEYGACETCRVSIEQRCDNPYGRHRHPNFKKLVVEVDDTLVNKYPLFKKCKFVCAYCVHRALKERRRRKEDRVLIKKVRKKVSILVTGGDAVFVFMVNDSFVFFTFTEWLAVCKVMFISCFQNVNKSNWWFSRSNKLE